MVTLGYHGLPWVWSLIMVNSKNNLQNKPWVYPNPGYTLAYPGYSYLIITMVNSISGYKKWHLIIDKTLLWTNYVGHIYIYQKVMESNFIILLLALQILIITDLFLIQIFANGLELLEKVNLIWFLHSISIVFSCMICWSRIFYVNFEEKTVMHKVHILHCNIFMSFRAQKHLNFSNFVFGEIFNVKILSS